MVPFRKCVLSGSVVVGVLLFVPFAVRAQDEPPPLPSHAIEGCGGIFSTFTASLVNPAEDGEVFGLPSVAGVYVHMGHGRDMKTFTITETLWDRVELGYGWDHFDMGDLPRAIERGTGTRIGDDAVDLHNFNARLALMREGEFEQTWLPALTFGVHYKYNDTVEDVDHDLQGTLEQIGIEENEGWDFTLYTTKMITAFPRPLMVSVGLRSTQAAHIGLLGFTDDREIVGEGNLCLLATDRLLLAAEYRKKPDEYDPIPGLVEGEDDWWTLCAGYIVNSHMTVSAGYAHFGDVLNHEANSSWGVKAKWEF